MIDALAAVRRITLALDDGRPYPARHMYRVFRKVAKEAGSDAVGFHDLRHTAATLMLRSGVNRKVASDRLGHATVAFTLDTYAHVLPDMQRAAAETLSNLIRAQS
jgi:integrase